MTRADRIALIGAAGLLAAAVAGELRLPAAEREWHGRLWGIVPYDLRRPTIARARRRLWDPSGPLLSAHVFGVGWTLNVGRLARLLGIVGAPAGDGAPAGTAGAPAA